MTKKQKNWLTVFLAMFIIPEILWSSLRSFLYIALHPGKFTDFPLLFNILPPTTDDFFGGLMELIQFIGLAGFSLMISKLKMNKFLKIFILAVLIILLLFNGFLAWVGLYYMLNTPQIG